MRTIRTTGTERSQAVADAIEAVLVAEVLSSSKAVWLVSPWVSDIPVIDNSDGRYAGLTALPRRHLTLLEILDRLSADESCALTLVARDAVSNANVLARFREFVERDGTTRLLVMENVHDKSFLTDRVLLSGSMNFTFSGTEHNTESLTVVDEHEQVNAAHVQFADLYGQNS